VEEALIGGTARAAPRTWLHNIKVEQASERLADELARKAVERERRQKAERATAAARLIAASRSIRPVSTEATIADMATVSAYGVARLTGIPIEGARGFRVSPKLWQSAIWARALIPASAERGGMIYPRDVLRELGDCIAPAFKNEPGGEIKDSVRQVEPGFLFPSESVATFLHKLFLERVLEPEGPDHFRLEDQISYSLDQRTDELDAQTNRDRQAKSRLRAILENIPADERDGFSLDRWLTKPIPQLGVRLADIVGSGDGWGTLQMAFGEIERLLRGGKPIEITLGLPIEEAVARAVERERKAVEAAEHARAEAEQRAARERSNSLTRQAVETLGQGKGEGWVFAVESGGLSFHQLAASSPAGLSQAETALREAVRLDRIEREAANCRAQLELAAKKAFGVERAALFMRAHDPRIEMSPFARCTDAIGLRDCLSLLPNGSHGAGSRTRRGR
jgi:hypothetical protein